MASLIYDADLPNYKGLDVVVAMQFLHFFSESDWRGMLINTTTLSHTEGRGGKIQRRRRR